MTYCIQLKSAEMFCRCQFEAVRVVHRQCPYGAVLVHRSGWKLVYSGDTMPCDDLVEAGYYHTLSQMNAQSDSCLSVEWLNKTNSTNS